MSWLEKYYHDVERGETIADVFRGVENRNGIDFPVYETEKVKLIVGYEMRNELENLMEDKHSGEYKYDTKMSDDILDFMEHCIRLTKDPFYNLPMRLMLWQKAWIETLFSFKMYDEFLKRYVDRFVETLLLIARKNTKSETSSGLLDTLGFMGGKGMTLVAASNTYEQAKLVYAAADKMRMLLDPCGIDSHRNRDGITFKGVDNELVMMSDRTAAKEGKNITYAVVDEEHEMPDNTLIKPIQQSMGVKINQKMIKITTEGFVADGQLDDDLKKYRAIINGEDKSIAGKRKLPWLYTQDSEAEVWETNEQGINPAWQKANPTLIYGVKQWSYLRDNVDEARRSKADRIFVLSKDFNFKVSNSTAWLDKSDYDYISEFDLEDFRGAWALGAVDLSETTDTTNAKIMLRRLNDNRKYILSHYWIPESKLETADDKGAGAKYHEWAQKGYMTICEGNDNDLSLVADWFFGLSEKYGIQLLKCGYDQRFKRDWIQRMEYYGWNDKEELIMINQSPDVLHTANCQVEADLKDRLIVGLNDVDKWCFGNAALKVDNRGKSLVVKIDNMKSRKIDGAVCSVILQETFNRYKTDWNDYLQ